MKRKDRGLFDEEIRMRDISNLGDPLEKLNGYINWEDFKSSLESVFKNENPEKGGRPRFDVVMMFKILVLQQMNDLADDKMEFMIKDRLSFQRFLGLGLSDTVPDSKTIWFFREQLTRAGAFKKLFRTYTRMLEKSGLIAKKGIIVDATISEVPRQRNSRDENLKINRGEIPESWNENPPKLSQKDVDARWYKKHGKTFYGYKNHIKVDKKSKLILNYMITPASVHDSQALGSLLSKKDSNQKIYADSAYTGIEQERVIKKFKLINRVHEKSYRNRKLTLTQVKSNKRKSRTRARVEHVFAQIHNNISGKMIRCIGFKRAEGILLLKNLIYNIQRSMYLTV